MKRAVWIAGRGAISGFGAGHAALVDGVFAGRSALSPRQRTAGFPAPTSVAGEIPAAALESSVSDNDLIGHAGAVAGREALVDAGVAGRDIGLFLASTKADLAGITMAGDGYGSPLRLAQAQLGRLRPQDQPRPLQRHLLAPGKGKRQPSSGPAGLSCRC